MLKKPITILISIIILTTAFTACDKKDEEKDTTPKPVAEVTFENSRYGIYNETLNWEQAKLKCEEYGGHLVTITSQEEQAAVLGMITETDATSLRNSYFMGATDINLSGEWKWVTDETFEYTDWKKNEPKPQEGEQYLSVFAKTYNGNSGVTDPGKWNDCMKDGTSYAGAGDTGFFSPDSMGFICEWKA
ncbi:MAG: C-type lectin domain-containing protein [Ruminococcus sp.]|jgi:hypothetical protein|nr:C-type lectin domain-containing protein [Ruminococcus sp.]